MAERDRFELDLADALRAYAEDAPTQVRPTELARQYAAAYPLRRTAIGPWRLAAIPRLAWVLLVLVPLLAALVAGTLFMGSQLLRKVPAVVPPVAPVTTCQPGTTPDKAGSADQARPPLSYAAPMAFDRHAGRLVLLALRSDGSGQETWTFDVCTNTWTRMHPDQEPGRTAGLVYDVDSDVTITLDLADRRVWVYDLAADTWTARGVVPMTTFTRQPRLVYDPVSGLVIVQASTSDVETDPSELWTYEVETDSWIPRPQTGAPDVASAHEGLLAYDASVDRLVGYDRTSFVTRLLDIRSGIWSTGVATPQVNLGYGASGGEIAYDEATRRTVVFSDGLVTAYDAGADRWATLAEGPPSPAFSTISPDGSLPIGATARLGHWMVYDPLNARLVVYGGSYRTSDPASESGMAWVQADDVLAFDPAAGRWTVLLEASEVQPAP